MSTEPIAAGPNDVTVRAALEAGIAVTHGLAAIVAEVPTWNDLQAFANLIAASEREACSTCVPSNWCDPLLTGPDAVVGKAVACQDIEAVLLAVKKRIESRSNV